MNNGKKCFFKNLFGILTAVILLGIFACSMNTENYSNKNDTNEKNLIASNTNDPTKAYLGSNLVINGNFSSGTNNWTLVNLNGATGSWNANNGYAYVYGTNTAPANVQLDQTTIHLEHGCMYELAFDAQCDYESQNPFGRYLTVNVLDPIQSQYFLNAYIALIEPTWIHYQTVFTVNSAADVDTTLQLCCGGMPTRNISLDNITIRKVDNAYTQDGSLLYNTPSALINWHVGNRFDYYNATLVSSNGYNSFDLEFPLTKTGFINSIIYQNIGSGSNRITSIKIWIIDTNGTLTEVYNTTNLPQTWGGTININQIFGSKIRIQFNSTVNRAYFTIKGVYGIPADDISSDTNLILSGNVTTSKYYHCPGYIQADNFTITNSTYVRLRANTDNAGSDYIKLNSGFSVGAGCTFDAWIGSN